MAFISNKIIAPLKKHILIFDWIHNYSRKTFVLDSFAGITLAAYAIPVSMAYATLAGLPPQYGIYGYLLGGLFYAFFGSSKQLGIGPTSAISLLIGVTLSGLSKGNVQHWIDLSSLTAMIFAIISVLFYFLRMSSIINFISSNVLLGFKAGAAITIGMTQLPKLFGVPGGGDSFFSRFGILIQQIPQTNIYVLLMGILAIGLIVAGEKLFPNKPVTIIVVIISIVVVSVTSIETLGVKTVGFIPQGLPKLHFPRFNYDEMVNVTPLAFACFLLAYIESVSTGRTLAQKNGYEVDARQELLAIGAANLATSLGNGYPVSGGLSQSAVNDGAGAKTPMALIIASFTIGICLLFLTGYLKNLPSVLLACIVLVAIKGLINVGEFKRLWKINRSDFFIAILALVSVVMFGILKGVLIGASVSLILIIKIVSNPNVAFLGRIPGTNRYSDFKRHHKNEILPHILLCRVEAPMLYFNVNNIYNTVYNKVIESENDIKVVIMDLSTSAYIDSSGARLIKKLYYDLKDLGILFHIAEAHSEVRDMLRKEDAEELFGHISRRDSLHDVVINCLQDHLEWEKEIILSHEKNIKSK
jgi:high affinity sulfate transporter 1